MRILLVLVTACSVAEPPPVLSEQQKAVVVKALAAGRKLQHEREATRRAALEKALGAEMSVGGPPCRVAVRVIGKNKGLEATVSRAFGTDEESKRERLDRAMGGAPAKSPQRKAELADVTLKTKESTIVEVGSALRTPSQQGKHILERLDSYEKQLTAGFRFPRVDEGDRTADAIGSKLEDWPKTELIVVEDARGSGESHGRAFLYDTAKGAIVCSSAYKARNTQGVTDFADAVLDLRTEMLRAAASHLIDRVE